MSRAGWLAVTAGAAAAVACAGWALICPGGGACATALGVAAVSGFPLPAVGPVLVAVPLLAWGARTTWLVVVAQRSVSRLRYQPAPRRLRRSASRTGLSRIECLASTQPAAFCAGAVWPKVFVSRGMVGQLRDVELDAVLLHEKHHLRRRDPLRRAATRAAADVFFFAPVVAWWAHRGFEASELAADRAAIRLVGARPIAGALWTAGSGSTPELAAGFGGAATLRALQLLGDPVALTPAPAAIWVQSVLGTVIAVGIASCIARGPFGVL